MAENFRRYSLLRFHTASTHKRHSGLPKADDDMAVASAAEMHKDIKSTMVHANFDLNPIKRNVDRASAEIMALAGNRLPIPIDAEFELTAVSARTL